ncbi:MAG: hypothetical protein ACI9C4_000470 [Paraglaciecola sp.]|jgi:hypothetical protein
MTEDTDTTYPLDPSTPCMTTSGISTTRGRCNSKNLIVLLYTTAPLGAKKNLQQGLMITGANS